MLYKMQIKMNILSAVNNVNLKKHLFQRLSFNN